MASRELTPAERHLVLESLTSDQMQDALTYLSGYDPSAFQEALKGIRGAES
ncbi:hypothetical protein [Streptosporangium sp. NPDC006007]|uniref:hypothetical protein n=1 Tax=Streptosporangium sp. NPDC006007 TaxID=3154575 RepID=UPI0033A2124F